MIRSTLANLRYRKARLALSSLSICLGVAFVCGTLVLGASMKRAYFDGFAAGAKNVSAAVIPAARGVQKNDAGPSVPQGMLGQVRSVAGVAAAEGRVTGQAALIGADGKVIRNGRDPGFGINVAADPQLLGFTVTSGRLPDRDGEVAVDATTAGVQHFRLGQVVRVVDHQGSVRQFRLTGTIDLGVNHQFKGSTVAAFTTADAFGVTGRPGYDQVVARAAPGVSQAALASRIRALHGAAGYQVLTGSQLATDEANDASHFTQQFTTAILVFALIALAVACVVIYNTFTILIAQRSRELALMRCVGATRRQVFGGTLAESVAAGAVASAAGAVAGAGLGWALERLFAAFGAPVPSGPVVLTPSAVAISMAAGLVVTVVAAVLPARSATRVAPVAALGSSAAEVVTRRVGRIRVLAGCVLAALGVLLAAQGTGRVNGTSGFVLITAGGVLCFLATLAFGPLFVPPLTGFFGWLLRLGIGGRARAGGAGGAVPVRLASANARRHPHRVAATTAALTIGITIMTVFTIVISSVQASSDAAVASNYPFDYLVQASGDQSVPPRVVSALSSSSALDIVAPRYDQQASVSGRTLDVGAWGRSALGASVHPVMVSGSLSSVVSGTAAVDRHVRQGGTIQVSTPHAGVRTFRVVAVYNGSSSPLPDVLITVPDYLSGFRPSGADQVFITARPGVPPTVSGAAVNAAIASDPLLDVTTVASYKASLSSRVNTVLALFDTLLGLAILIALVGIANTLSLSVLERTAESAVLRAIGMTRGQLRGMLLAEALLMALLGITVGVFLGSAFGWVMVHAFITSTGGTGVVSIPFGQIALYVLIGAAAAVAAAVLPSRRAARASVVSALAAGQ